jgi:hypothetical protein
MHLRNKFHLPDPSGSLVVTEVEPKGKVRTDAIFLFYTLQKYYLEKGCVFIQGLFAHIISGPTAWGDSIAPA